MMQGCAGRVVLAAVVAFVQKLAVLSGSNNTYTTVSLEYVF